MPTPQNRPDRKWVKIDKHVIDYFSHFRMTANERLVILTLAIETDWRTESWVGTLRDLSTSTRITPKTLRSIFDAFVASNILRPVTSFKSNTLAEYDWVQFDNIVIPERNKGGRPLGSRDSYPRERKSGNGSPSNPEEALKALSSVGENGDTKGIGSSKYLMNVDNGYNSSRETASRDEREEPYRNRHLSIEGNAEPIQGNQFAEFGNAVQPPSGAFNPCVICQIDQDDHSSLADHQFQSSRPSRWRQQGGRDVF